MLDRTINVKADIPFSAVLKFTAEATAIAGLGFAVAIRLNNLFHPPSLWIDETFTGAIAGQKNWGDFIFFARADAPPSFLYYCFMHFWQMIFGLSDASLRAPSLICSLIAPLIIILSKVPGLSRTEKLSWAALLALWIPGIGFAQDARCYAMLLMFATVQTLTFYRLLQMPTLRQAVIWILSADLTMFGNYDAAYLAIAQGLIFLVLKRKAALQSWPAVFLVIPVVLELIWKWPFLSKFERIGTAWYPVLRAHNLLQLAFYPISGLGAVGPAVWIFLFPILCLAIFFGKWLIKSSYHVALPTHLKWVALASFIGAITMITIGFLRPTFTWRYMPPFEPGILLGLILMTRAITKNARDIGYIFLIGIAILTYCMWLITGTQFWDSASTPLNIEESSEYLMKHNTHNVVFTWDSPTPRVMPTQLLDAVGGFFFARAGVPVKVTTLQTVPNENPNIGLLNTAKPSDASIIWIYDLSIHKTATIQFPPSISKIDPRYDCQNFGELMIGSVACFVSN
jgi:uncharacterized membrane protein